VPQFIFLSTSGAKLQQATYSLSGTSSQYLAGYEVSGPGGTLNYAAGDWYVPSVKCSIGENSISYYQVGFDTGPSNNGFVNEGVATSSGCNSGHATYSWYFISVGELSQLGNPTVHAGDHMSTRISISSIGANNFKMVIKDLTAGHSWTEIGSFGDDSAPRSIALFALIGQPPTFLSNFSIIKTSNDRVGFVSKSGTLGSFVTVTGFSVTMFNLVNSGNSALATTSSLIGKSGGTFRITFVAPN